MTFLGPAAVMVPRALSAQTCERFQSASRATWNKRDGNKKERMTSELIVGRPITFSCVEFQPDRKCAA